MNDGLGEGIHGLAQALGRAFVPVEAALKVIIFGLAIGCMVKPTGPSCWPGFRARLGVSKAGAEDPSREQQRQERKGKMDCTPKVRHGIKGQITLNGGEQWICPDSNIPAS